jgi:hypothetical protein
LNFFLSGEVFTFIWRSRRLTLLGRNRKKKKFCCISKQADEKKKEVKEKKFVYKLEISWLQA